MFSLYVKNRSDMFVKKIIEIIKNNDGEIFFVKLVCSQEELLKRVVYSSRKEISNQAMKNF